MIARILRWLLRLVEQPSSIMEVEFYGGPFDGSRALLHVSTSRFPMLLPVGDTIEAHGYERAGRSTRFRYVGLISTVRL